MYKKYRYNNTDIHVYEQTTESIRLLQHDKLNPLSYLRDEKGNKPKAVINCSYFTPQYVLGRNQGDLLNNTHDQGGFYDLVFLNDGSYRLGNFKSWDYCDKEKVLAGFSVATILILDSINVAQYSSAICNATKLSLRNPQTAIGVLKSGKVLLIVADGRTSANYGLNGYELRTFVKNTYPSIELLCQLDGGGSSEILVDGSIKNKPSDGKERNMLNGLSLIGETSDIPTDEPIEEPKGDGNMLNGIDISSWQNTNIIDNYNVDFVIMKASEGVGFKDKNLDSHYNKVASKGLLYGFYHYARPDLGNTAEAEADWFLSLVGHHKGKCIYALDWEDKAINYPVDWALKWLNHVYEKTGVKPLFYASSSVIKQAKYKPIVDNDYGLWVAHYDVDKPSIDNWSFYTIWQYTREPLDKDYFNGTKDTWLKYCDSKLNTSELDTLRAENKNLISKLEETEKALETLKNNNNELENTINTQAELISVKERTITDLKTKLNEINKLSEV